MFNTEFKTVMESDSYGTSEASMEQSLSLSERIIGLYGSKDEDG